MNIKNLKGLVGAGAAIAVLVAGVAFAAAQAVPPMMSVGFDQSGNGFLTGSIASVGSSSITVNTWGGAWLIDIDPSTQLTEHYGHPAQLGDFQVGDNVRVDGSVAAGNPAVVEAVKVHDLTLQYAFGTFHGTITAMNGSSSLTFQSVERGAITVFVAPMANITVNGASSTYAGLTVGAKGTIWGNWDRMNANLDAHDLTVTTMPVGTSTPM